MALDPVLAKAMALEPDDARTFTATSAFANAKVA